MKTTGYDQKYRQTDQYWGREISKMALKAAEMLPSADKKLKVLDIGCGEGANAIFFARSGYDVTAFDLSKTAIEKTKAEATKYDVRVSTFIADINEYLPEEDFDIIFSSGTLQYLLPEKRKTFVEAIQNKTNLKGLNVLHTFIDKSFIERAPDAESSEILWESGELLSLYKNWRVESFIEEIKPCNSSGVLHEHAHNRIWAKKI